MGWFFERFSSFSARVVLGIVLGGVKKYANFETMTADWICRRLGVVLWHVITNYFATFCDYFLFCVDQLTNLRKGYPVSIHV